MRKNFFSNMVKNESIKKHLENCLAEYGVKDYACAVVNKNNIDNIAIITNMVTYFTDVYLRNDFQRIDPIVINSLNRVSPLIWDENLMINSQWTVRKLFNAVKPYHNVVSGQSFILHAPNNNMALLSLYINKFSMSDIDDKVRRCRNDIQGLLIDLYDRWVELYQEERARNIGSCNDMLSVREAEILYWSSIGKTYPETARILNITISTVKFHMANIVRKMGVNNAKHAISLGIELNLVSQSSGKCKG